MKNKRKKLGLIVLSISLLSLSLLVFLAYGQNDPQKADTTKRRKALPAQQRPKDSTAVARKPAKSAEEIYKEMVEEGIKENRPLVPQMILELKAANPDVRSLSIGGLGKALDTRAIEPLIQVMKNDSIPVNRGYAAHSLGAICEYNNDKSAVPALQSALNDNDMGVALNAALALTKVGEFDGAFPLLVHVYKGEDMTEWRVDGFADFRSIRDDRELVIEHQKWAMRLEALRGLIKIGDARVIEILQNTLNDITEPELLHRTQKALAKMQGKK